MRAIGRFLEELAGVFVAGVFGFFLMLVLAAGVLLVWLTGCMSGVLLIIALAESAWWLHRHSHQAAVTALGYYGYASGTFALISVLFFLKEKLTGWPEHARQQVIRQRISGLRLVEDAPFESSPVKYPNRCARRSIPPFGVPPMA
jgi:hypothetical protein